MNTLPCRSFIAILSTFMIVSSHWIHAQPGTGDGESADIRSPVNKQSLQKEREELFTFNVLQEGIGAARGDKIAEMNLFERLGWFSLFSDVDKYEENRIEESIYLWLSHDQQAEKCEKYDLITIDAVSLSDSFEKAARPAIVVEVKKQSDKKVRFVATHTRCHFGKPSPEIVITATFQIRHRETGEFMRLVRLESRFEFVDKQWRTMKGRIDTLVSSPPASS